MKIPNQVKVGGKHYQISYPYLFAEREDRLGQTNNHTNKIFIADQSGNKPIAIENIEETFFHEIIHAIDWVYNGGQLEEEVVSRLSEGLYQVLSDNNLLSKEESK